MATDGPAKLAAIVNERGRMRSEALRAELGCSAEVCRSHGRRARDRGLIDIDETSHRIEYLPLEPREATAGSEVEAA